MQTSKYVQLDPNVLLEWIYDDQNYISEDYRIIIDTLHQTRAFSNAETTGNTPSQTNNTSIQQLFLLDATSNKYGIVNPNVQTNAYLFLQFQNYSGSAPSRYDRVRLHFPANYTFADYLGIQLGISLYDNAQTTLYPISNYFYDKSDPTRFLEIAPSGTPFNFQEVVWEKYVEIMIPSPYALTRSYQQISTTSTAVEPIPGTIHQNLMNSGDILSLETPIFIDFRFLNSTNTVLGQKYYITTEAFSTSIPVSPEYETLGVTIQPSTQGDYFEIFGTFNSDIEEFNTFIQNSSLIGKNYYAVYEVDTFEKNVQTQTVNYFQYDNFDVPISHRPIIMYSTTTAVLEVTMKLVNSVDNSSIIRISSYSMLQNEVAKYGLVLTKINISNSLKPKIYNSKPDILSYNNTNISTPQTQTVQVPYCVMYERYNILTKVISTQINDTIWYGQGQNQIMLYHTDNIIMFAVAQGTTTTGIIPYAIPQNTTVTLQFKSETLLVEVQLYTNSNQVSLGSGILVFDVASTMMGNIGQILTDGYDQFYIVLTSNNISTVLYAGRFLIYNQF